MWHPRPPIGRHRQALCILHRRLLCLGISIILGIIDSKQKVSIFKLGVCIAMFDAENLGFQMSLGINIGWGFGSDSETR
ncbi:hypothetical protein V2J09_015812 [Rumex salicifolius]